MQPAKRESHKRASLIPIRQHRERAPRHHRHKYELFDEPLGDNAGGNVTIRVPNIRGITANAPLAFTGQAQNFNLVRRRPKTVEWSAPEPEVRVFYELTPSGSYMVKILEVLVDVSAIAEQKLSS
jgi:hypothetical protein